MKTKNYSLDLLLPEEINKEVFLNENIAKIDTFLNMSISDFVLSPPAEDMKSNLFIITAGDNKNKILYSLTESSPWEYMDPIKNMIIYLISHNSFYLYNGTDWDILSSLSNTVPETFSGSDEEVIIKKQTNYYYLTQNTKFCIKDYKFTTIDFLLKQNAESIFEVEFDVPILWKDDEYISSRVVNNFDYIRLLNLPETDHFFGEIVKSNFSY